MLSNGDLERLIAEKRRDIENEKIVLGLSSPGNNCELEDAEVTKENGHAAKKTVRIEPQARARHGGEEDEKEASVPEIPADLERYIRRYLGLPVMLKAGEYSPNNPLVRGIRPAGDVLLGLGEYERRRDTLRKLRQQQYREYLDQQAKLKQEAKEQAERERKEREEKERQRDEERERARRQIEEERERKKQEIEQERERARENERRARVCYVAEGGSGKGNGGSYRKVDTAVQVGISRPLSVAVQTDDADLYRLADSPTKHQITQAERELSPRTVVDQDERPIQPASWTRNSWEKHNYDEKTGTHWDKENGDKLAKINGSNERNRWGSQSESENRVRRDLGVQSESENRLKELGSENEAVNRVKRDLNIENEGENRLQRNLGIQNKSENRLQRNLGIQNESENRVRRDQGIQNESEKQVGSSWGSQHEGVKDIGLNWSREQNAIRRRSYGDFDERCSVSRRPARSLVSDLRHSYMPSIFDADAIHLRNQQAEKEAAERRQFYQQELKNQIQEQQRIREERKTREKMLELAEMRRLEDQLRMLRVAQERETGRLLGITHSMKENATEFEKKRTTLQKEIDYEQQKLRPKCHTAFEDTSKLPHFTYDTSKLPHYTPSGEKLPPFSSRQERRQPFSTNIPDNSIFSPNYDVDSYLRKNLNPKRETLMNLDLNSDKLEFQGKVGPVRNNSDGSGDKIDLYGDKLDLKRDKIGLNREKIDLGLENRTENVIIEKALVHERPKEKNKRYEPSFLRNQSEVQDDTPIPVLRHSPKSGNSANDEVLDGMKLVENKWKVPAVQKNILKSLPNDEGKNVSILTQLGSIRRQLQLEQLRLDNMISYKSD